LAPGELIARAEGEALAAVAVTDHDTLAGLAGARAAAGGLEELRFVPGIEVSALSAVGPVHLLGLFVDPASVELKALIERLQQARRERNPRICARLREMGVEIPIEELLPPGREIVSRAHIAAALVARGLASSKDDAFRRFVGEGAPAYVPKDRLAPAEVIGAIHASGGLAVLAHPSHVPYENLAQLERIVRGLLRAGLDGLEAYHTDHTPLQTRHYLDLAGALGLETTGGSDFHAGLIAGRSLGRPKVPLGGLGVEVRRRLGL
jgi:hypothetical protein